MARSWPSPEAGEAGPAGRRNPLLRLLFFLLQMGLVGLVASAVIFAGSYLYLSRQLAGTIDRVVNYHGTGLGGTPRFFDRHGQLLFELTTVEKRRWLAYDDIPQTVKQATVAVEDDTFWTNPGFDPASIAAALVSNLRHREERPVGASTITQQLVRLIAFSYEERASPSYQRKGLEIFYAFILTRQRSKESILEMYLNEIYYGNLAYGIEAAAQTYFGKPAGELSLAEAAFLAGLPQNPVAWNPYSNFDGAKERQESILELMVGDGVVDTATAQAAREERLHLAPLIPPETAAAASPLEAPHFILYVQEELARRYGADALTRNGWQITTSLDLNIQHLAESVARQQVAARQEAHQVSNAAVVALKPATGEILAMVGSLDYFDAAIDGQVNMALQPRQPGSSFKPITYAAAMQQGWTTGDVLWDVPIQLDLGNGQVMQPVNYDGRFHGPLLLRDALANSYNIPPIQLIRDVGVASVIATGRSMGIESLREPPGYYGLALTLGGGEVPLLEMTRAFATLANLGQRPPLTSVLRIVDSAGNVVFDQQKKRLPPANALDPGIAYILSHILSDNQARTPAMGANSPLRLPFPAAAKTGTTNDFRDNWTIGYTPGLVVGVWMGNSDGRPMRDSSGLRGAAPVWNQIMQGIMGDGSMRASLLLDGAEPPGDFPRPEGVEERPVCLPQGTGDGVCSASRTDLFIRGGPVHTISRLGYQPDVNSHPGAWTLAIMPLPADQAQAVWQAQPPLDDGTRPPLPAFCALNTSRPPAGATMRLLLPVPPYYPDEVRARLWAQQHGYQMAPASGCPASLARAATGNGGQSSGGEAATLPPQNGNAPPPAGIQAAIFSPVPGQQLSGVVPIVGTARLPPGSGPYYKLEVGSGSSPQAWTTFGTTHSQPVEGDVLEWLHADALPPGDYTIRLVLVGADGNFLATNSVSVRLQP